MQTETTDQEMDVWIKLKLHSPSITTVKTISFTVTPVMRKCGAHDVGYRQCGSSGSGSKGAYCIRDPFFCDGVVNCASKNSPWPTGKEIKFCLISKYLSWIIYGLFIF